MKLLRTLLWASGTWLIGITVLHAWLNLDLGKAAIGVDKSFKVGFLPVTCHLTCPVNHFIQKNMKGVGGFEPKRFNGFPELKEAFLAKYTSATFILAPMAMKLREDGVPVKIVHLGHRDGTAMMVHKQSQIYSVEDLRGKTVAVPNRYSNQRILLYRSLKKVGMSFADIELVEMPPPDMPAALYSRAVDAITSGEPFMAQTELDGYGRVLWLTKDVWPGFISCVLAVHEDVIREQRPQVQALVDGIASSGLWIDEHVNHRMQAAQFVSSGYFNQDPRLLEFVLSKPPDRVTYTNLSLLRKDFEEIEQLAKEAGILDGTAHFEDYCDDSFAPTDDNITRVQFEDAVSTERARQRGVIK